MMKYMKCLQENEMENTKCRQESLNYLKCRMDRQLILNIVKNFHLKIIYIITLSFQKSDDERRFHQTGICRFFRKFARTEAGNIARTQCYKTDFIENFLYTFQVLHDCARHHISMVRTQTCCIYIIVNKLFICDKLKYLIVKMNGK